MNVSLVPLKLTELMNKLVIVKKDISITWIIVNLVMKTVTVVKVNPTSALVIVKKDGLEMNVMNVLTELNLTQLPKNVMVVLPMLSSWKKMMVLKNVLLVTIVVPLVKPLPPTVWPVLTVETPLLVNPMMKNVCANLDSMIMEKVVPNVFTLVKLVLVKVSVWPVSTTLTEKMNLLVNVKMDILPKKVKPPVLNVTASVLVVLEPSTIV